MKKIFILLVLAMFLQAYRTYGTIVVPTNQNEFEMSPTAFTVNGSGGGYAFTLTCDRYMGGGGIIIKGSSLEQDRSGDIVFPVDPIDPIDPIDPVLKNVKGFEYISFEDTGGQVDSVVCIFPGLISTPPIPGAGSTIYFKPNGTSAAIRGEITIRHYTVFMNGTKKERTLTASYTQQVVTVPSYDFRCATIANSYLDESGAKKNQTVTYYDEFGKPEQTIQIGASFSGKDIVNFVEYDNMGRSDAKNYLPYPISSIPGSKRDDPRSEQRSYYNSRFLTEGNYAFAEKKYESGGFVSAQGGVGSDHAIGSGYFTTFDSRLNLTSDNIKKFSIENDSVLVVSTRYPDNTLIVKRAFSYEMMDKIGSMNKEMYEYYDSEQKLIAQEERISADDRRITYYVYDERGLQRYVIPPIQFDTTLQAGRYNPQSIHKYCYYNEYDEYGRVWKQCVPGTDYVLKLYDNRGRLAMTQDGNQRASGQWSFTKYDAFDRPVLSGVCTGGTYGAHKAALKAQTVMYEQRGSAVHGYTNDTYPSVTSLGNYLTVFYYDDYDWLPRIRPAFGNITYYDFSQPDALGEEKTVSVKGSTTGTMVKVLGVDNDQWLTTVNYYNDRGEMIQTFSELYGSGVEIASNAYDFTGQVIQAKVKQMFLNPPHVATTNYEYNKWFTYDDHGRLLKVEQQITGDTRNGKVVVAEYTYDDLGHVSTKSIHNGKERTSNSYNISEQLNRSESNSFTYELGYAKNGNVSQSTWVPASGWEQRKRYEYTYNRQGMLTAAGLWAAGQPKEGSMLVPVWEASNNYAEKDITYDRNGNIWTLKRTDGSGSEMHNITYEYDGNQLRSVRTTAGGIVVTGFAYDHNGNMTFDPVNNVHISYNMMNLPQKIFDGTNEVSYIYTSGGDKVGKQAGGSFTYYRGVMVYSGSDLLYMLQPEGTVSKATDGYTYNYFKTDHTGSTRAVLSAVGGSLQQQQSTDYYPFGLAWSLNNLNKNKYLYSGKELQTESVGTPGVLGLYDFGARYYNPVLGRWFNVDPKLQGLNPYAYCGNSPIMYVDPDGQFFFPILTTLVKAAFWGVLTKGASYGIGVMLSPGGFDNWNWGSFYKSLLSGALSSIGSLAIGQFVGPSGGFGTELLRGVLHGAMNGGISSMTGGNFMGGFGAGAMSSWSSSAIGNTSLGRTNIGQYTFAAVSGGIGSVMGGGNFWSGAGTGLLNVGMNHMQHRWFNGSVEGARKEMGEYTQKNNKEIAAVKVTKSYMLGLRKVHGAILQTNPDDNVNRSRVSMIEKDGEWYVQNDVSGEAPLKVEGHMHTHPDQSDINHVTPADRDLQSRFGSQPIEILYRGHVYHLFSTGGYVKTNITY